MDFSNDDELKWEEISTEHLIQNEWIDFRISKYRFPDGTEFEPYYSYSRRDYVVIVPFDEDGNLICVRQFRQGIKEVTTEFPAGGIERTDGKEYGARDAAYLEDAMKASVRELKEETGYVSEKWEHLLTIPSNATIADNYAHIFVARDCRKVSTQDLDDTEYLNVCVISPEKIEEMIKEGKFQQAVHVMAWYMCRKDKE
ncbi:MAG: NUDIX hydrolase [Clostridiales bacterium]|nr:NUDIX hydrolase [Clostridiales bacterium]